MNLYIEWAVMRWLKEHGADANAALVRKALAECDDPPADAVEREPERGRLTFEPVPEPYTYHIKQLHEILCPICGERIP